MSFLVHNLDSQQPETPWEGVRERLPGKELMNGKEVMERILKRVSRVAHGMWVCARSSFFPPSSIKSVGIWYELALINISRIKKIYCKQPQLRQLLAPQLWQLLAPQQLQLPPQAPPLLHPQDTHSSWLLVAITRVGQGLELKSPSYPWTRAIQCRPVWRAWPHCQLTWQDLQEHH